MFDKILFISPHVDDAELGCGGTIARFISEGKDVYCAAFTDCRNAIPKGFEKDSIKKECLKALEVLTVKKENILIFEFENKQFPKFRDKILDKLEELRMNIDPDIVFIPSRADQHQDHQTITQEAIRAFRKNKSILGYEEPWNNLIFENSFFISLEDKHIKTKMEALKCYGTQKFQKKGYFDEDYMIALAKTRGVQVGKPYAEAFEVIKLVY